MLVYKMNNNISNEPIRVSFIDDELSINIAIVGNVSVGKSTLLNMMIGDFCSDVGIVKITNTPIIYSIQYSQINRCMESINNDLRHHIIHSPDLFGVITSKGINVNIFDMPHIDLFNHYSENTIFFNNIFQKINILIWMTDINNALSSIDEKNQLEKIIEMSTSLNNKLFSQKVICLFNKLDDMCFYESNPLDFSDKIISIGDIEQTNIYNNANNILFDLLEKYEGTNIMKKFIPISAENSFIYEVINRGDIDDLDHVHQIKLCKNECGLNTWKSLNAYEKNNLFNKAISNALEGIDMSLGNFGYYDFMKKLNDEVTSNAYIFISDNIKSLEKLINEVNKNNSITLNNYIYSCIEELFDVEHFLIITRKAMSLHNEQMEIFGTTDYNSFWNTVTFSEGILSKFIDFLLGIDVIVVKMKCIIAYSKFELIYKILTTGYGIFSKAMSQHSLMPSYPVGWYSEREDKIKNHILRLFEQLSWLDYSGQKHISPQNTLLYLRFINENIPEAFDKYSIKFLEFNSSNTQMTYSKQSMTDITKLIEYVYHNSKRDADISRIIYSILLNRQYQMSNDIFEDSFIYFLLLKSKLESCVYINDNNISLMILKEVVNKNISILMSVESFIGFYRSSIDYNKMKMILDKTTRQDFINDRISFETKLLDFLFGSKQI